MAYEKTSFYTKLYRPAALIGENVATFYSCFMAVLHDHEYLDPDSFTDPKTVEAIRTQPNNFQ